MLKFLEVTYLAGFLGNPNILCTRDLRFLNTTDNYSRTIEEIITKTQSIRHFVPRQSASYCDHC